MTELTRVLIFLVVVLVFRIATPLSLSLSWFFQGGTEQGYVSSDFIKVSDFYVKTNSKGPHYDLQAEEGEIELKKYLIQIVKRFMALQVPWKGG
ncbi:hypothetical protein [uncultured Vagococcus sp.]|uniref:hypothetical protein n=1 Tax=uncultured Vagococcus sp. TaxID=189676 RepID=UPI0028D0CE2E|nr:hypothetical protein [uncultured Vagococcus sp.]